MKKQTIVFVSEVVPPDTQITGTLIFQIAQRFADANWNVELLGGFPAGVRERHETAVESEFCNGVHIVRGGSRSARSAGLIPRIFHQLRFVLWVSWRILVHPGLDLIVTVTNPPIAPFASAACAWFRRFRGAIIVHDVYPDGLIAVGFLRDGALTNIWRFANRLALRSAEAICALGDDMRTLLINTYGLDPSAVYVCRNWNPYVGFAGKNPECTRLWQRLGIKPGTFVVQYSGNMGLWSDIKTIVRAAAELKSDPNIVFVMIGGGRDLCSAKTLAAELKCTNIIWLPFQPVDELDDTLACCHIALISLRDCLEGIAVPSKFYGILATGRPIAAQVPASSEIANAINRLNCGWVVQPNDARALALAITGARATPSEVQHRGHSSTLAANGIYSKRSALERYFSVLSSVSKDMNGRVV